MDHVRLISKAGKKYSVQVDPDEFDEMNNIPGLEMPSFHKKVVTQVVLTEDTEPVHFDAVRIAVVCDKVQGRDMRYFFYIVAKMERNDIPVPLELEELTYFGYKSLARISEGLKRLVLVGLLFRGPSVFAGAVQTRGYFVNPLYAWRGDRTRYLTAEYLATLKEKC